MAEKVQSCFEELSNNISLFDDTVYNFEKLLEEAEQHDNIAIIVNQTAKCGLGMFMIDFYLNESICIQFLITT